MKKNPGISRANVGTRPLNIPRGPSSLNTCRVTDDGVLQQNDVHTFSELQISENDRALWLLFTSATCSLCMGFLSLPRVRSSKVQHRFDKAKILLSATPSRKVLLHGSPALNSPLRKANYSCSFTKRPRRFCLCFSEDQNLKTARRKKNLQVGIGKIHHNVHVFHRDSCHKPCINFLSHGLLLTLDQLRGTESERTEETAGWSGQAILDWRQMLCVTFPGYIGDGRLTTTVRQEEDGILGHLRCQGRNCPWTEWRKVLFWARVTTYKFWM